jgi:hypothetical protein
LELAELIISSTALKRFVYVSSAYANGHLHQLHDKVETEVCERIYPLRETDVETSTLEIAEIRKRGTTPEFLFHDFPAAYCYAKHLTERSLLSLFRTKGREKDLLILRPAVLGPALAEPVRGFQIPESAPATGLCTALITNLGREMHWASRFPHPEQDATLDEVPVDIVVNRILIHILKGTDGCVHAVAGKQRVQFQEVVKRSMAYRRLPWKPRMRFHNVDWHSKTLSPIATMFTIIGTSYLFDESKTEAVWAGMNAEERRTWPLFLASSKSELDVKATDMRAAAVRALFQRWLEVKKGFPRWLSHFVQKLLVI